ncbi:MAG: hypothetical protein ACON30_05620 [Flavobacteriaceae bacterium]
MKSTFLFLVFTLFSYSQTPEFYNNKKGDLHLCGEFPVNELELNETFKTWFNKSYSNFELSNKKQKWAKNLKNVQVDIYLGTWCGDSKNWVPKFIKLWDELGLNRNQLKLIALYDGKELYKQGPNNEEEGLNIHRVPTFIFRKNNNEIARIVEYPRNDLQTDVAQIALGVPSNPNYAAANYLYKLLDTDIEDFKNNFEVHYKKINKLVGKSSELNTLGYVFLRKKQVNNALNCFELNTYLFPYNPNVYDSFGEALMINNENKKALKMYEKVLKLNPSDENAKNKIQELKNIINPELLE